MSLIIQRVVKGKCFISGFSGWHADSHPSSGLQRFTQPRRVVASVCQKRAVIGEEMLEDGCTLVVADLSFSQQKQDRTPMPVTNNMEFGIQAAFCSSYKTWRIPFLSRLAAVRRTLRWVESSIREPSKGILFINSVKIILKIPSLFHPIKRLYNVLCGPYSSGASFH